jgi:hypothetical protein
LCLCSSDTGGAAQYIDVMVLGKNHIYSHPTPQVCIIVITVYDKIKQKYINIAKD